MPVEVLTMVNVFKDLGVIGQFFLSEVRFGGWSDDTRSLLTKLIYFKESKELIGSFSNLNLVKS